jgi:hypothetical protein
MPWQLIAMMNHKMRSQSMLAQGVRSDKELVFERFHESLPGFHHIPAQSR